MRRFCLIFVAGCVALSGCRSKPMADGVVNRPIRGGGGAAGNNNFWDENPVAAGPKTASAPIDPRFGMPSPNDSELDGVLAGRVVDGYDRPPGKVFIRVTLVDPKNPDAKPKEVGVSPNAEGYFVIQGLQAKKTYSLAARAEDGERVMGAVVQAQPPYTRLLIRVSEEKFSSAIPAAQPDVGADSPFVPPAAESPTPRTPKAPPAAIPPAAAPEPDPIPPGGPKFNEPNLTPGRANPAGAIPRSPDDGSFSPGPRGPIPNDDDLPPSRTPAAEPAPRFDSIADGPPRARDPVLNMPNPRQPPPRAEPPSNYQPSNDDQSMLPREGPPPRADAPSDLRPVSAAVAPVRAVSRGLNFTVFDPRGQPWEFGENSGRLVLIDFWSTTCRPCLASMPEIQRITSRYGASGLEVVGVALEDGPWREKASRVAEVHRQKRLNYRVFLEGENAQGGVQRMFGVKVVPTLILLTHDGKEVWRGSGQQISQLEAVLQRELQGR